MPGGAGADATRVAAELLASGVTAPVTAHAVIRHFASLMEAQIESNASGRPGPNVITGAYRASIQTDIEVNPSGIVASTGTPEPQGPRLEFGFTGSDSRGRHYNQPPFPHFGPAIDRYETEFPNAIAEGLKL